MMQAINTVHNLFGNVKSYDIVLRCHIYGIDVNDQNPETDQTALHYAVQRFYTQDVHLLLRLGIKVEIMDKWGRTAYDYALRAGNKPMARLLALEKVQQEPSKSLKQKLAFYYGLLKRSSRARNQQILKWAGITFSTSHTSSKCC